MQSARLAVLPLLLVSLAGCTERDRRPVADSGPSAFDAGPFDGGPGIDAPFADAGDRSDTGPPMEDAGPPVGSCIGACGAAELSECPSFDRTACQDQCTTERSAAGEAGCSEEHGYYLGCRQTVAYTCDASGQPVTTECDDEEAAWAACMEGV